MAKKPANRSIIAKEMIEKRKGRTKTIKDKRTKRAKNYKKSWKKDNEG